MAAVGLEDGDEFDFLDELTAELSSDEEDVRPDAPSNKRLTELKKATVDGSRFHDSAIGP